MMVSPCLLLVVCGANITFSQREKPSSKYVIAQVDPERQLAPAQEADVKLRSPGDVLTIRVVTRSRSGCWTHFRIGVTSALLSRIRWYGSLPNPVIPDRLHLRCGTLANVVLTRRTLDAPGKELDKVLDPCKYRWRSAASRWPARSTRRTAAPHPAA